MWAVYEDVGAFGAITAMVISADKKFYARYALSQPVETRYVEKMDGVTRRYRCPQFGSNETFCRVMCGHSLSGAKTTLPRLLKSICVLPNVGTIAPGAQPV